MYVYIYIYTHIYIERERFMSIYIYMYIHTYIHTSYIHTSPLSRSAGMSTIKETQTQRSERKQATGDNVFHICVSLSKRSSISRSAGSQRKGKCS